MNKTEARVCRRGCQEDVSVEGDCEYRNREIREKDDRHEGGIKVPQVNDTNYVSVSQRQKCTEHSTYEKYIYKL